MLADRERTEVAARELHDAVFAFNQQMRPWGSLNTAEREWFMDRARLLLQRVDDPDAL